MQGEVTAVGTPGRVASLKGGEARGEGTQSARASSGKEVSSHSLCPNPHVLFPFFQTNDVRRPHL